MAPPYTPATMRPDLRPPTPRFRPPLARAVLATALLLAAAVPVAAQGPRAGEGVRAGLTFGGISTVGVTVEYFRDSRSMELAVGTWTFRDLSAALAFKQYFGAAALKPYVGAGLWLVGAAPTNEAERIGLAGVLHFPVGVDWRVVDDHYAGLAVNVNRGLFVRRSDPEDDLPLNDRLIPLPGAYYRWGR
ncbi:MAG: hypothetical protein RJQ04_10405 [Longimicrobiales bacterium]